MRELVQQQGEQRDRRGVVQQALAFHQAGQSCIRADVAEHADHRAGVGGGDDRAEQQADRQRLAGNRLQRKADRRRGRHHRHHREHQHRRGVAHQPAHVDRQPAVEHQRRQEREQENLRVDREVGEGRGELAQVAVDAAAEHIGRAGADQDADEGQQHGVRDQQAARQRLDDADEDEHRRHRKENVRQGSDLFPDAGRSAAGSVSCGLALQPVDGHPERRRAHP